MAEITGSPPSDPARHRTLAPFGGITRIRFKGSSDFRTSQPLRLPRINYVQNRTTRGEVNAGRIVAGVCLKRRILERRLAQAPLLSLRNQGKHSEHLPAVMSSCQIAFTFSSLLTKNESISRAG